MKVLKLKDDTHKALKLGAVTEGKLLTQFADEVIKAGLKQKTKKAK